MSGGLKKLGSAVGMESLLGGTGAGLLANRLLKRKKPMKTGAVTPLPDEEEVRRRKRRELARRETTGRSSTILTADYGSDSLGY